MMNVVGGVFDVGLYVALLASPAHGQQSISKLVEPNRFALVIGNASYGAEKGNLLPLGSPCSDDVTADSDAKIVNDALVDAKWQVEMTCNLTTADLRTKISDFNDKVLRETRAFGIIYFSGHGAQAAGTNYLFGVDAFVDAARETSVYKQNSYAPLFGGAAVPLDEAMRKVQPLWGKAVAVFIDACRTNPILENLRDEGIHTIRYPSAASEVHNILYAFSTRDGLPSPDGGLGGVSRYARLLSKAIRAKAGPDYEEIEQVVSAVGTSVILDSRERQFTGRAGTLQRPPRFCLRGCPSPIEDWESYNDRFGPRSDANTPRPITSRAQQYSHSLRVQTLDAGATVSRASMMESFMAQAAAASVQEHPPDMPATNRSSANVRALKFDVLYCAGDGATDQRKAKSEAIRDHLLSLAGSRSPVGGFETGEVRVIAVSPAVNQSLYKARDSFLAYNRDSPAQKAWATQLQSDLPGQFRIEEKPGMTSDYMSILVCDGATPAEAGPTIYLQAAREDQLRKASAIGADLTVRLPNAKVSQGVEVVRNSPSDTEVRYFTQSAAADAARVARALAEQLDRTVKTRYIAGYEAKLNGNRLVEVWIGKNEDLK